MTHYDTIRKVATWVTMVGVLWYGAWSVDGRYAKAADVSKQISSLTVLYLQSILMDLRRQLFDLLVAEEVRVLSVLEKRRMSEIHQEIQITEEKIHNGGK